MPEKSSYKLGELLARRDQLLRVGKTYAQSYEQGQIPDDELDRCIEELRAIRRQLYALDLNIESLSMINPGS